MRRHLSTLYLIIAACLQSQLIAVAQVAPQLSFSADTTVMRMGGSISIASYNPDGSRIVTAGGDTAIRIWDAVTGQELRAFRMHKGPVRSAEFHPDGVHIVSSGADSVVRIWHSETGAVSVTVPRYHGRIYAAVSPDGQKIATTVGDTSINVVHAETGGFSHVIYAHSDIIRNVRYDQTGTRLITVGEGRTCKLLAAETGEIIHTLGPGRLALTARFSPDGRYAVVSGSSAAVFDLATGDSVLSIGADLYQVYDACYSPDGNLIVTTSVDKLVRVWDAKTGALRAVIGEHSLPAFSVVFSPDGTHVLTSCTDNTATIWPLKLSSVVTGERPFKAGHLACAPNPAHSVVWLSYDLKHRGDVRIDIVDALGRECSTVVNTFMEAGAYSTEVDVSRLSAGTYFCVMQGPDVRIVRMIQVQH